MKFLEMGLAFAALGFVVLSTVISLLVALYWRAVRPTQLSSGSLFALRMLPAAFSAIVVFGLVVPSFLLFEPRTTSERAGPVLVGVLVLAGILVALGLRRAVASWLHTRRLERGWKATAVGSVRLGIRVRAYLVPSEMPLAALVGIVRPRLFLSDRFLNALSVEERNAVLEHEAGHRRSLDNLKRTAMSLAPDWLSVLPAGREMENAWAVAAEAEADDHAVRCDRARSLDLAGALLKAARMAPIRFTTVSNFCDESTITRRISRLLSDEPVKPEAARPLAPRLAGFLASAGAVLFLAGPALRTVYALMEGAVRLLQ